MQLSPVIILATLCIVLQLTSSAPVTTNSHASNSHWLPAVATWYGSANGDGSDGKHIIKPHFTLSSDRNVKTFSHYIPEYRRSVWLRYVGRRETVTCEGWSGEPYPLQERWRLRSLLQGSVLGQEYMFPKSRHRHHHRRVSRLFEDQHSLWSQWCGFWSTGYLRRIWSPPQPWSHSRDLPPVHAYFIIIIF